ncbi:MAG TPA: formate dehydrogenase accessory protein FdhE [Candidatus Dormibacteraeota bacterium]|nr:formate dehydrogenase accessory protein FdhE [Candidatus Dormibacteraeota bacterium]
MAVATATATLYSERKRRVGELRERYRFARQVLDFYGALLSVQERAYMETAEARPGANDLIAYVAEMVVPKVAEVTVAAGPDRLRTAVLASLEQQDSRAIIGAWIQGADQTAVDRFLARAALTPVLEAADRQLRAVCSGPRDARHCPDCGGAPQVSASMPAADDLATGSRVLACARCSTTWGYPRLTCAGCGEDSSSQLQVFAELGTAAGERGSVIRGLSAGVTPATDQATFPHIRIEACNSCRQYLLAVDVATDRKAVPLVDELAAIPLDLYARDRGFTKITPNLMGF